MSKYYTESDGGDFWTGEYWSRNPKVFYVVNSETLDRVFTCYNQKKTMHVCSLLNAGEITEDEAVALEVAS